MVATPIKTEPIDTLQAERMLASLGIGQREPVILCTYGKTNRYFPSRRQNRNYDWVEVTTAALAGDGRNWPEISKQLQSPETANLGFIPAPGGTAHQKRKEIEVSRLLVYEIDGETLEDQWGTWEIAGLPDPTLVLDTGNKSLHVWYKLDRYHSLEIIKNARERLSQLIEDACGFQTDPAMHNTVQPARLAGAIHPKSGRRSEVVLSTGNTYKLEDILKKCPEVSPKTIREGAGELFRPNDEELSEWDYPKPHEVSAVPLTIAISAKSKALIETGQREGQPTNRYSKAYSISQTLQAAKQQLLKLGYKVANSPEQLFDTFARNSGLDIQSTRDRHFEVNPSDFGCGELSKTALRLKIATWATDTGQWVRKDKPREPLQIDCSHLVDKSISHKLDFFNKYVVRTVRENRNTLRRNVYLRDVLKKLKLSQITKDELAAMVMEAQDVKAGNSYKALTADDRKSMKVPQLKWVIDNAIPAEDLTIVSGRPKVGKTRLAIAVIAAVLNQKQFLNYKALEEPRKVILITDDQADADTHQMLTAAGIYEHPNLLWSRRFRTTERQIDSLLRDIEANPNCLVVPDSLRSITRSTGIQENDVQMGMLVYDLKQSVIDAAGTLLLIHHANKTDDQVGGEAVSGHGSIVGAANTIFTLHYLKDKKGLLQKDSPLRRVVREARSGAGLDAVIKQNSDVGYAYECGFDELAQREERQAERDKKIQDLLKIPPTVRQVLDVLYEKDQLTVLEAMKEAKLCRSQVQQKKDFNKSETKDYNIINIKIREYKNEGFIESKTDASGRRQFLSLTPKGKVLVADGLIVSDNSSHSSIPSVISMDLKE